jgi:hypothetical protein
MDARKQEPRRRFASRERDKVSLPRSKILGCNERVGMNCATAILKVILGVCWTEEVRKGQAKCKRDVAITA